MSSGLIIRLIDVVLIILVGFVSISDLRPKSQIALPQKENVAEEGSVGEQVVAMIFIKKDEYRIIIDKDTSNFTMDMVVQLEERLIDYKINSEKPLVVIDPSNNSPLQYTVNMIDLCSKLELPKSVLMHKN